MLRPAAFSNLRQTRAKFFISARTGEERPAQRAQVKASAANQEDPLVARFDFFNFVDCGTRPIGGRKSLMRRHKIDQMVWNAATLLERHLGRSDLDLLVNLNGIAVDNLAAETERQFDSQTAFAGSGRSDDRNDWWMVSCWVEF